MTKRAYSRRPSECIQEDCSDKVVSRGYCSKHYTRFRKYGSPDIVMTRGSSSVEPKIRFEAKYSMDNDGCWIWTGATNGNGWATFSVGGKAVLAHRYSYEIFKGPIPDGFEVTRTCEAPVGLCVNPDHLELVSNNPVERFWKNVGHPDDSSCWNWLSAGFVYRVEGKAHSPRKFAYELTVGPVEGVLYSLCGNARCIRPEHSGTAQDRFWAKVDKNADGCWYWTGSKLPKGYPHCTYEGKSLYAHRLTYEWAGGILKENHLLVHTCRHLDCVNPDHIEQISYQELVRRREENKLKNLDVMYV